MSGSSQQQVAVVTGGAQGIGLAAARRLARDGWKIALWDRDQEVLSLAIAELGDAAIGSHLDVTDQPAVERAAAECEERMGLITGLVHCAAITGPNLPIAEYGIEDWKSVIEIDLTGTFIVNREICRRMMASGYGRILNIASIAGKEGNPNAGAYSAAKAGVIALTKSLGKELAGYDIAVNCLTPAAARTRIFDQMTEEHIAYMLSKIPRNRFLEVTEAADMIAWLISPENSFATGGVFDLSGGRATY